MDDHWYSHVVAEELVQDEEFDNDGEGEQDTTFQSQLIDSVRSYPHLYNKLDPNHKDRDVISNTWSEIAQSLGKNGMYSMTTLHPKVDIFQSMIIFHLQSRRRRKNGRKCARSTRERGSGWRRNRRVLLLPRNLYGVYTKNCVSSMNSYYVGSKYTIEFHYEHTLQIFTV
jgi:hypothetical protein